MTETQARNEHPLHHHEDETGPWTRDTLAAHLHFLHGVDNENVARGSLAALTTAHDRLNHGTKPQLRADWGLAPADGGYLGILTAWPHADRFTGEGQKFSWSCRHVHVREREAAACAQAELDRRAETAAKTAAIDAIGAEPAPDRRQESMELAPCEHHPGEHQLTLWGRTLGTSVCLTGTDRVHLAALLLPESEGLKALQDIWSVNLGPGGRRAVEAGHAAGYKLGVQDMEHTPAYRTAPASAGDVIEFLTRLAGTAAAIQGGMLGDLGSVTEFLEQMKARSGDEADRG